jgi:hypothetical protein
VNSALGLRLRYPNQTVSASRQKGKCRGEKRVPQVNGSIPTQINRELITGWSVHSTRHRAQPDRPSSCFQRCWVEGLHLGQFRLDTQIFTVWGSSGGVYRGGYVNGGGGVTVPTWLQALDQNVCESLQCTGFALGQMPQHRRWLCRKIMVQ